LGIILKHLKQSLRLWQHTTIAFSSSCQSFTQLLMFICTR